MIVYYENWTRLLGHAVNNVSFNACHIVIIFSLSKLIYSIDQICTYVKSFQNIFNRNLHHSFIAMQKRNKDISSNINRYKYKRYKLKFLVDELKSVTNGPSVFPSSFFICLNLIFLALHRKKNELIGIFSTYTDQPVRPW